MQAAHLLPALVDEDDQSMPSYPRSIKWTSGNLLEAYWAIARIGHLVKFVIAIHWHYQY
jgi:hypothetical protein